MDHKITEQRINCRGLHINPYSDHGGPQSGTLFRRVIGQSIEGVAPPPPKSYAGLRPFINGIRDAEGWYSGFNKYRKSYAYSQICAFLMVLGMFSNPFYGQIFFLARFAHSDSNVINDINVLFMTEHIYVLLAQKDVSFGLLLVRPFLAYVKKTICREHIRSDFPSF